MEANLEMTTKGVHVVGRGPPLEVVHVAIENEAHRLLGLTVLVQLVHMTAVGVDADVLDDFRVVGDASTLHHQLIATLGAQRLHMAYVRVGADEVHLLQPRAGPVLSSADTLK